MGERPIKPILNSHKEYKRMIFINPYRFNSIDPDALTFLTANGTTNEAERSAIDVLVKDWKAAGIWSDLVAYGAPVYPMVGGTAARHGINLINPSQYALQWFGTWVHSSTGAKPNGVNAYADTGYKFTSIASSFLGYYSRTNGQSNNGTEIGATDGNTSLEIIITRRASDGQFFRLGSFDTFGGTETDSRGLFSVARTALNSSAAYKNKTLRGSNANASTSGVSGRNIFIGARNAAGTAASFSDKECAFAVVGPGVLGTKISAFYDAIQKFQTSLGRAV